ncbi:ABC transporter permease [Pollutimonas subterranea]|uniref:ABC transporter permease n=1 Tax=Pollutimonas subterranea TaxID=2045210 RepID=A0A2N4U6G9_9BURK|nr:amino acid ABC transporter permease [Pollutimonas subterranea]PLC50614.1 ABC transporter permease [Pollutimonas subterranea]
MNVALIIEILPAFMAAALVTLKLSLLSIAIAAAIGFLLNAVWQMAPRAFAAPYRAFIWIVRGTPFLAQLFVLYFGLPQIGISFTASQATVIGLSIYGSAYFAEIFRASWQAISPGQIEAGRAFGMRPLQVLMNIQAPQAVRLAIPMLTNQAILILKESSVASIITVPELTKTAGTVVAETFSYAEPYILLGLIYWGLALALAATGKAMERVTALKPYQGV